MSKKAEQYIEKATFSMNGRDGLGRFHVDYFIYPEHAKTACEIAVLEEKLRWTKNQLFVAEINSQIDAARIIRESIQELESQIKAKEKQ